MKVLIKKLPVLLYAIIIIAVILYITKLLVEYLIKYCYLKTEDSSAIVTIYYTVITLMGLFFIVIQIQQQKKNNLIATEYMNQPDFQFLDFHSKRDLSFNGKPACCCVEGKSCTNNCTDEHWFNLKQIGSLPASEISISLIHNKELPNIFYPNRIFKKETLIKNDVIQYKLPPNTFNNEFWIPDANNEFNVLLEYKSLYSGIRYKRWYKLEYQPIHTAPPQDGLWAKSVIFFYVSLERIQDEYSSSLLQILSKKFKFFCYKKKCIKEFNCKDWVLHF